MFATARRLVVLWREWTGLGSAKEQSCRFVAPEKKNTGNIFNDSISGLRHLKRAILHHWKNDHLN